MSAHQMAAQTKEWSDRLVGQIIVPDPESRKNTFSHDELPASRRILPPGSMTTRDMREDRLNVHTDEQGKVSHVTMG